MLCRVLVILTVATLNASALGQFVPTDRFGFFHLYTSYADELRQYNLGDGDIDVSQGINSPGVDCRPPANSSAALTSSIAFNSFVVSASGDAFTAPLPPCEYGQAAGVQTLDDIRFVVDQLTDVTLLYEFYASTDFPEVNPPRTECFLTTMDPTDRRIVTAEGPTDTVIFTVVGPIDTSGTIALTLLPGSFRFFAGGHCRSQSQQHAGFSATYLVHAELNVVEGCAVDFDHDGFVTGLDFDLFMQSFAAGDMLADFDGDGFLSGIDFDLFVQAFEAGC